jgi:hypothetical protein
MGKEIIMERVEMDGSEKSAIRNVLQKYVNV